MATESFHIIQKQVVNITLPDIGAALAWSAEGHQDFVRMISDQLERSLSELDTHDHLIIEKMELDLGRFTPAMLQPELPGRFHKAFREALEAHRSDRVPVTPRDAKIREASQHGFDDDRQRVKTSNENQAQADEPHQRLYNTKQARLESLLFFLRKGYLPWWGSALTGWDEPWLEELTSAEVNVLKDFFTTANEASRSRLITQFSDAFIDRLLWRTTRQVEIIDTWLWLKRVIENLKEEQTHSPQGRPASIFERLSSGVSIKMAALRHRYWMAWMAHAWNASAAPTLESVLNDHKEYFIVIRKLFQDKVLTELHGVLTVEQVPVSWRAELERKASSNEAPSTTIEREVHTPEQVGKNKSEESAAVDDKQGAIREVLLSRAKQGGTQNKTKPAEASPDVLWVNEAGVILLHPFLPQLFRSRGWVDQGSFVDDYGQTMAVYALHYLATGEVEAPEHQLLLPKLLTGMRLETALHPVDLLTEDDRMACDELLIEVVKHWNALRNTSAAGLRDGYLRRSGKLENQDGKWRLTVEHKAQDILLSRLPWPISMIKLPWMTGVLSVTWD
jgi:hypothetical protein